MKSFMISVMASAMLLVGCQSYDRVASYMKDPVVSDVKVGMTHDQVKSIAGKPLNEVRLVNAQGSCQNYAVAVHDGKSQAYFVSFDQHGRVMNKGFQSCNDYDQAHFS